MRFRHLLCFVLFLPPWIVLADDRITVEAKINNQPVRLAFDTGAGNGFVLWRAMADQLGLKLEAAPPDFRPSPGEVVISKTEPVKFEGFGQTLPDLRFSVIDIPPYLPMDIHGLVGWRALKENILILRMADRYFSVAGTLPVDVAGWLKMPLRSDRDQLVFSFPHKSDPNSGGVLIDTGMDSGIHLSTEKWREWRAAHRRAPSTMTAYFTPAAGLVVREECWADEITLGGMVFRDVIVTEANPGEAAIVGVGYAATLGLGALCQLDLVIDGPKNMAYVQIRRGPASPVRHNRLGALFAPRNEQNDDLVARVAPNSPATAARIRDGDVLLKIDQLDVTPWRTQPGILPLARFWEQVPGTKLRLSLRRDGKLIVSDVVLKNILGPESAAR